MAGKPGNPRAFFCMTADKPGKKTRLSVITFTYLMGYGRSDAARRIREQHQLCIINVILII